LFGLAGGAVWGIGTVSFLVASSAISNGGANLTAAPIPLLGPAVTTAVGWGAPLLAVLWGLVAWKEFRDGGSREQSLATIALVLFAAGLVLASIAPLYAG
jgi:glucose uptake protein